MKETIIAGRCSVVAIMEHYRTTSGRRDHATGVVTTTQVNLGWHIHIEANGSVLSIPSGPDRPEVKIGDELIWRLERP